MSLPKGVFLFVRGALPALVFFCLMTFAPSFSFAQFNEASERCKAGFKYENGIQYDKTLMYQEVDEISFLVKGSGKVGLVGKPCQDTTKNKTGQTCTYWGKCTADEKCSGCEWQCGTMKRKTGCTVYDYQKWEESFKPKLPEPMPASLPPPVPLAPAEPSLLDRAKSAWSNWTGTTDVPEGTTKSELSEWLAKYAVPDGSPLGDGAQKVDTSGLGKAIDLTGSVQDVDRSKLNYDDEFIQSGVTGFKDEQDWNTWDAPGFAGKGGTSDAGVQSTSDEFRDPFAPIENRPAGGACSLLPLSDCSPSEAPADFRSSGDKDIVPSPEDERFGYVLGEAAKEDADAAAFAKAGQERIDEEARMTANKAEAEGWQDLAALEADRKAREEYLREDSRWDSLYESQNEEALKEWQRLEAGKAEQEGWDELQRMEANEAEARGWQELQRLQENEAEAKGWKDLEEIIRADETRKIEEDAVKREEEKEKIMQDANKIADQVEKDASFWDKTVCSFQTNYYSCLRQRVPTMIDPTQVTDIVKSVPPDISKQLPLQSEGDARRIALAEAELQQDLREVEKVRRFHARDDLRFQNALANSKGNTADLYGKQADNLYGRYQDAVKAQTSKTADLIDYRFWRGGAIPTAGVVTEDLRSFAEHMDNWRREGEARYAFDGDTSLLTAQLSFAQRNGFCGDEQSVWCAPVPGMQYYGGLSEWQRIANEFDRINGIQTR